MDINYFLRNTCLRTDRQVKPCFHCLALLQRVANSPSPRPHGRGHPRMVSLLCPTAAHKLRAQQPERDSTSVLIHNRRADCLFVLCPKTCAPLRTGKFPALPVLPGQGAQAANSGPLGLLGLLDFRACLQSQEGKSDRRGACCIGGTRISSPYVSPTQSGQPNYSVLQRTVGPATLVKRPAMQAGPQNKPCKIS